MNALSSNSRNLRRDIGPGIGHWHLHMMVFTSYYENSMLGGNEFAGALPFVSDDAGTLFTVTVINPCGSRVGSKRGEVEAARRAELVVRLRKAAQSGCIISAAIKNHVEKESRGDRYDFEQILDECGYQYLEKLENPATLEQLRRVQRN